RDIGLEVQLPALNRVAERKVFIHTKLQRVLAQHRKALVAAKFCVPKFIFACPLAALPAANLGPNIEFVSCYQLAEILHARKRLPSSICSVLDVTVAAGGPRVGVGCWRHGVWSG